MSNPDMPTYSKASFHKQPKDGFKLVMRFALVLSSFFRFPVPPLNFFSSSQEIFEKLWAEFLLDQAEQVDSSQNSNTGLAIGGHASIDDDELAQDLTKLSLCPGASSTSPPVEFGTPSLLALPP